MFTRLTTTTWSTKVVFVVLAGLMLLTPALVAEAQDTLDPNSPAQNPPGGGNVTNTNNPSNPNAPGFFGDFSPVNEVINGTTGEVIEFQQSVTATDADGNVTTFTTDSASQNAREAASRRGLSDPAPPAEKPPATDSFVESGLKAILYSIVVNLFGTLTGWAGILLDFGINKFVIGFGTAFNSQGVGQAVNELWSLVRDFFNILFIFGFIWIGFQMILDSGNSQAKQTLVSLIMAALLVNFSLFISKFVVDFSNRLASEIAQEAFPIREGEESVLGGDITKGEVAVANTFFAHMGIPRTLDVSFGVRNNENAAWSYIFGSAIFYLVAAFVFAAGGIMLIIRFVVLSIFMVLSPFMFLGWVFPGMQGWTGKYWKGFLGRAFYAPVYIVLLFFAGTILQNFFGDRGSMVNNFQLSADGMTTGSLGDILPAFILSCAFLIAAVQVAGKMSADGASGMMKIGNNLQRGGRRFVARKTIGLGAYGVSAVGRGAGKYVERFDAASQKTGGRRFARGLLNTATLGATSNSSLKAATGAMAGASVAGSQTREQYVKEQDARKKTNARITTRAADEAAIKAAEEIDPNDPSLTVDQKALLDKREAAINNYSPAELEEMGEKKRNKLVGMLKAGTVSKLLDSDNLSLSSTEKASLQKQYRETIEAKVLDSNKRVITEELTKLSEKQLDILGTEFAETYAGSFSEKQMEGYKKSDAFTERQKDSQKATRRTRQTDRTTTAMGRKTLFRDTEATIINGERRAVTKSKPRKASEIANLPFATFVDESSNTLYTDAIDYLTVDVLKQMARNANQGNPGAPDDSQRAKLARLLKSSGSGASPRVSDYLNSSKGKEDFLT